MISLNAPVGGRGGEPCELGDLIGEWDDPSRDVAARDEVSRLRQRLGPLDFALLTAHHAEGGTVDDFARRLGTTKLSVTRRLRKAERNARGRKRGPGGNAPGAGVECPIGTVRIIKKGARASRYIKVRMDGKQCERWRPWARVWWEQHRGPVPAGKCVLHKDGDTLNDRPDNLVLGGHADRAFLAQERMAARGLDPFANTRKGCAAHNRERSLARDVLGEMRASLYYIVDHDARTITGPVGRRSADGYARLGIPKPAAFATTRKAWIPPQLGWPGRTFLEALALHVLGLAGGQVSTSTLLVGIAHWAERLGQPYTTPFLRGTLASAMSRLRRDGLVSSARGGRLESRYRITPNAVASRGPVCQLAVMNGRDCEALKGCGYDTRPATEVA